MTTHLPDSQATGSTHASLIELSNEFLVELADLDDQGTRISIYQATNRHHPENQQDPIRFRTRLRDLERSMRETLPAAEVTELLEPFEALGQDAAFWNHTLDGLAVFGCTGWFRVVRLRRTVPELTVVADSFHTKPLRRYLQSQDRFQILGLNHHEIQLFEGDRHGLEPIDLAPGVPGTIGDALGHELTEPHQTVASYGGAGGGDIAARHGHGGKSEEMDTDAERFFRAVDRAVMDAHSRPSGLPLILAALPEHHHGFQQASHNPFLLPEGIKSHPESISIDDLRVLAWEIFEPRYHARLEALADDFHQAKSKGLGIDDLEQIAKAGVEGRVATLLIEADREIFGRIHTGTGNVHLQESGQPSGDDLLDDLGEWVIKMGGQVFVLPTDRMPTRSGAAAICRY